MDISELLFRMHNVDRATIMVDGVRYTNYMDIPKNSLEREIYSWTCCGINDPIVNITTLESSSDLEHILHGKHGIFPKFSNEQMVLLVNNGVRLIDVINEMEDY